ncbi:MAG: hypothetical protein LBK42_12835 [Propionibacteriaceae bacterium]|jgi:hypothetical protein|nr:hypothetical protein [Propionibacteriaceae bacterium]
MTLLNARPFVNSLQRLFLARMASNLFYWVIIVAVIALLSGSAARACLNNIVFNLTMCLTYYPLVWVAEVIAHRLGYPFYFSLLGNILSSWPWFVLALLTGPLSWLLRHIRQPGWLSWLALALPVVALAGGIALDLSYFGGSVLRQVGEDIVLFPPTAFDYANRVATLVLYAGFIVWWADRFYRARAGRRRADQAAARQARTLEGAADD